jgi:hypothetical protein
VQSVGSRVDERPYSIGVQCVSALRRFGRRTPSQRSLALIRSRTADRSGVIRSASFRPRLGDLALDLAKGGQVGVVVDLPSDNAKSYHLRLPGGGGGWRARADGATLRPVAVPITHVTPQRRDVVYDTRAQQAALPVTVHHEDGSTWTPPAGRRRSADRAGFVNHR